MKEGKLNVVERFKQERVLKQQQLMKMIQKTFDSGLDVSKEKLIAVCSFDMGLSRRTSLEYIMAIQAFMGFVEVDGVYKRCKVQKKLSIGV